MSQTSQPLHLTAEEQKRVIDLLNTNGIGNCALCKNERLEINEQLGCLPTSDIKGSVDVRTIFPCVVVTCSNCGHMQFFSAMKLGLMAKDEEGES